MTPGGQAIAWTPLHKALLLCAVQWGQWIQEENTI
jgi:hypothetical protein